MTVLPARYLYRSSDHHLVAECFPNREVCIRDEQFKARMENVAIHIPKGQRQKFEGKTSITLDEPDKRLYAMAFEQFGNFERGNSYFWSTALIKPKTDEDLARHVLKFMGGRSY